MAVKKYYPTISLGNAEMEEDDDCGQWVSLGSYEELQERLNAAEVDAQMIADIRKKEYALNAKVVDELYDLLSREQKMRDQYKAECESLRAQVEDLETDLVLAKSKISQLEPELTEDEKGRIAHGVFY